MIQCSLPWPPSALRPNAGSPGNWRKKQTAAALYKSVCALELLAQGVPKADAELLHLTIRFCPPDRRRRDLDNMLASIKQGLDSIAERIGVDDHYFGLTLVRSEPVKGGRIDITITEE